LRPPLSSSLPREIRQAKSLSPRRTAERRTISLDIKGFPQDGVFDFSSVCYSNTTSSVFADSPIVRQVVDASAKVVSASYQTGSLQVGGVDWPQLAISQSAGSITLSWPSSPTVLAAQWSTNLGANWTNTGGTPVTKGASLFLTLPAPSNTAFCRLAQP